MTALLDKPTLLVLLLPLALACTQPEADLEPALQAERKRPLVIAHRGASGYLPEHTLPAYTLAFAQGADFIEPDLVATRDGVLVCLHDIHLEGTTDVEQRFPGRMRTDGRWYAADFDLEEIKTLSVHERLEHRFPQDAKGFGVPTLVEVLDLVMGLEKTLGRKVGIYPELKQGAWHNESSLAVEAIFLETTAPYGLSNDRVFVQSFEPSSLQQLRELGSQFPQVLLLPSAEDPDLWAQPDQWEQALSFVDGIGPYKKLLFEDPTLVARAHALNLTVHPYTLRNDQLEEPFETPEQELEVIFGELSVDGAFTDFPDTARHFVDRHFPQ